eukprot:2410618-Amphidinium_carterae.1
MVLFLLLAGAVALLLLCQSLLALSTLRCLCMKRYDSPRRMLGVCGPLPHCFKPPSTLTV